MLTGKRCRAVPLFREGSEGYAPRAMIDEDRAEEIDETAQHTAQPDSLKLSLQSGVRRDAMGRLLPGTVSPGKPFLPGQSGNPNGRGLEWALKRMLETEASERHPGLSRLQAIALTAARVAEQPEHPAWGVAQKLVWERNDGSVAKTLKIEGELPLKVTIRGDRD